ncbi:MAG: asparagine synthase C-terminal domain-containing protein, partial [Cytophagaceae bacterium]|nr:asparagine synthase C-terminal domain-containing protein [Cytophagaceae bacterium]
LDESRFARDVANYLKTEHYEFMVSEKDAKDLLMHVIDHFDEPFSDSSALPTYLVSKLASREVKMVLTGDGGDELFMGYGAYSWARRLSSTGVKTFSPLLSKMFASGNSKFKRIGKMFSAYKKGKQKSHIFSQEQYFFSDYEIDKLLINNSNYSIAEELNINQRTLSPDEEQALFDLKYYLKDDLLVKVDRTSMFNSLEAREPLLDYRLAEFSFNLSKNLKIKNGESKYLLKQVLYDYVPEDFFDRPKQGFSIPLAKWLRNDLKFLIDDYLAVEKIKACGVFNVAEVSLLKKQFLAGDDYLFQRIWLLILLQRWLLERSSE